MSEEDPNQTPSSNDYEPAPISVNSSGSSTGNSALKLLEGVSIDRSGGMGGENERSNIDDDNWEDEALPEPSRNTPAASTAALNSSEPSANTSSNSSSNSNFYSARASSTSIHIAGIAEQTSENTLRSVIEKIGPIASLSIVTDAITGRPRGFGFVTMVHDEDTIPVIKSLNGYLLDGNTLHVDVAKRNTAHTKTPGKYLGTAGRTPGGGGRGRGGGREGDYYDRHSTNPHSGSGGYDSGGRRGGYSSSSYGAVSAPSSRYPSSSLGSSEYPSYPSSGSYRREERQPLYAADPGVVMPASRGYPSRSDEYYPDRTTYGGSVMPAASSRPVEREYHSYSYYPGEEPPSRYRAAIDAPVAAAHGVYSDAARPRSLATHGYHAEAVPMMDARAPIEDPYISRGRADSSTRYPPRSAGVGGSGAPYDGRAPMSRPRSRSRSRERVHSSQSHRSSMDYPPADYVRPKYNPPPVYAEEYSHTPSSGYYVTGAPNISYGRSGGGINSRDMYSSSAAVTAMRGAPMSDVVGSLGAYSGADSGYSLNKRRDYGGAPEVSTYRSGSTAAPYASGSRYSTVRDGAPSGYSSSAYDEYQRTSRNA